MGKTEKDILTTAETARILGVSVRTAQLLIEGGSVPSRKTPGGHRRVYRADVMGLIERSVSGAPGAPLSSATVIIVTPAERLTHYDRLFAGISECMVETLDDVHRALFAIGSVRPHTITVDLEPPDVERERLLHSLSANPSLGHSRILAVAATGTIASADLPGRVVRVETAEQAAAAIRVSLIDGGTPSPPTDALFPIALNEGHRSSQPVKLHPAAAKRLATTESEEPAPQTIKLYRAGGRSLSLRWFSAARLAKPSASSLSISLMSLTALNRLRLSNLLYLSNISFVLSRRAQPPQGVWPRADHAGIGVELLAARAWACASPAGAVSGMM